MKKMIPIFLSVLLFLSGCSAKESTSSSNSSANNTTAIEADFSKTDSDMFTERDTRTEYSENDAVTIMLNGNTASATDQSVKIENGNITVTKEATYVISGNLTDGTIIVDAPDTAKLQLVLNGVNIASKTSAALYVKQADKVFITLAKGKENVFANEGSFTENDENINAAVYSKQDITFNGEGSLNVSSPAGHGIVSKDDLVFTSGKYAITTSSHGIDANDSVRIKNATFEIAAGKDGIRAENNDDSNLGFVYLSSGSFNITAEGDGISAGAYMQILDGKYNIIAGGGSENAQKSHSDNFGGFGGGKGGMGGMGGKPMRPTANTIEVMETDETATSMKGIKSGNSMKILGGSFTINSADDALHSNLSLTIDGGDYDIATGDDALHAEHNLTLTNGTINITESYEGLEALNIAVKGGNVKLTASDDGLNAAGGNDSSGFTGGRDGMFGGGKGGKGGMSGSGNGSIIISGGVLDINSSGDGIDANGTLEITGGYTTVTGPTQGDTATLDYDVSATISGGTFIGTGASGMAQTFSQNTQGVIAVSTGGQTANTKITLTDKSGKTVITHTPTLDFAVVILSSPEIKTGESYTLTVGTLSESFTAG